MAVAAKKKSGNKGLGRGLDALLGDAPRPRKTAENAAEAGDAQAGPKRELPIEYLKANADQPRRVFDKDAIDELAASIAAKGLLQPILVRPKGKDNYEIVAGERRWRAAQKAKLHNVPVIIRELTDEEAAEIALIENVQRVDLNPVEEAAAYRRLAQTYGRTQDDIAKAVGKSRSHVANIMRLLNLPQKAIDALSSGAITMGHARALLGSSAPAEAFTIVLKRDLSVRETESLVREAEKEIRDPGARGKDKNKAKTKTSSSPKDADTRALERDLSAILGLEVAIDHSRKGAGALTLNYLTLDQLDDICRRLMGANA
ncbi:ParB/RepB/Spo0J family partition protein [Hyphococcus sp.]|uniref:ParB/RepB/Spo0J family partition protein n=1 Tax=Hyphococcus sp. TaxID=2038636 RepID=UPI003CCB9B4C